MKLLRYKNNVDIHNDFIVSCISLRTFTLGFLNNGVSFVAFTIQIFFKNQYYL